MAEDNSRLAALERRWLEDSSPGASMPLAEEFRRRGRYREAVAVLESALRSQPNHTAAQVALGRCLLDCERSEKAIDVLRDVLRRDPAQLVANRLLVDALIQRRDAAGARSQLAVYETLNRRDPAVAELRVKIEKLAVGAVARGLFEGTPEEPSTQDLTESLPAATPRAVPRPIEVPLPQEVVAAPEAGEPFPELLGSRAWATYLRGLAQVWRQLWPLRTEAAATVEPVQLVAAPNEPETEVFGGLDDVPPPSRLSELLEIPAQGFAEAVGEPPASPGAVEVSATLGELYLRQGHADEAANIFRQVLERDPGDAAAAQGLRSAFGEQAAAGLASERAKPSRVQRIERLRRYLEQVRRGRALLVR